MSADSQAIPFQSVGIRANPWLSCFPFLIREFATERTAPCESDHISTDRSSGILKFLPPCFPPQLRELLSKEWIGWPGASGRAIRNLSGIEPDGAGRKRRTFIYGSWDT